jgi:16S rRNA processing protein RimM
VAERISLGKILRPHGLRGEVVAFLTSDHPQRVEPGAIWHVGDIDMTVTNIRALPSQPGAWVVALDKVADRTAAEAIQGLPVSGLVIDDPEADFVHQLIGAIAIDASTSLPISKVVAVIQNPAADILELENGVLIPLNFVVERRDGEVVADLPDGLLDLYLNPDG